MGTNPRHEAPIINTRIRKAYLHNNLEIGLVGELPSLNYQVNHIGSTTADLDLLLSGKHPFSKKLASAKKPLILVGSSVLEAESSESLLKKLSQMTTALKKTANKEWEGIFNLLQNTANNTAAFEIGYNTQPIGAGKFVYLLSADELSPSDIPKDAFVVYQGHHGDVGAYYADVILPGAAYTEKSATFVNTEGRAQTTRAAVTPPAGAREDWKIIRALSEVAGEPLPYDDIHELRYRMSQISPSLVSFNNVEPVSSSIAQLGLGQFATYKSAQTGPLTISIKDFYLTDPISRASATMAKCSQVLSFNLGIYSRTRASK